MQLGKCFGQGKVSCTLFTKTAHVELPLERHYLERNTPENHGHKWCMAWQKRPFWHKVLQCGLIAQGVEISSC